MTLLRDASLADLAEAAALVMAFVETFSGTENPAVQWVLAAGMDPVVEGIAREHLRRGARAQMLH